MLKNREILILSLAFFLIFFGYDASQQYLTTYLGSLGFSAISLIYLTFAFANLLAFIPVSRIGTKKMLLLSSIFYSLFILSVLLKNILTLVFAAFLGIMASFLWVSQTMHLLKASSPSEFGKNSGVFATMKNIGSTSGLIFSSILLAFISLEKLFLFFSIFPILAVFTLLFLKNNFKEDVRAKDLRKIVINGDIQRILVHNFVLAGFLFGFGISTLPLEITEKIGKEFIGVLSTPLYLTPILTSYVVGKLSDKLGRESFIYLAYALGIAGLLLLFYRFSFSFAMLSIILISLAFSISFVLGMPIIGDIAKGVNISCITSILWFSSCLGTSIYSFFFKNLKFELICKILAILLIASFFVILPVLRKGFKNIKIKY